MVKLVLSIADRAYSSWSMRPWLALTRAGIAFETRLIRLYTAETAAEIAAVSPAGTVPALAVGEHAVWDSLAICEWAAETAPGAGLWPSDPMHRALARSLAASLHAGFGPLRAAAPMNLHRRDTPPAAWPEAAKASRIDLDRLWRYALERSGGPFLAGSWSIADAMATPYATRFRSYGLARSAEVGRYIERVLNEPEFLDWEADALADPRRLDIYDEV